LNIESGVHYVDTSAGIDAVISALDGVSTIAVDTEFVRERTYYSRLCLIQVAAGEDIWCLDPLTIENATELCAAIASDARVKIFHAARQDLEIFYNTTATVPGPIFDTQIAAALLGRPDQIAYAALVSELCGIDLDKSSSRTDWARRPLSDRQVQYAAGDVRHLGEIMNVLETELKNRGREQWFVEECGRLTAPELYKSEPADAWRRLKGTDKLGAAEFTRMVQLAAWREATAKTRDLPRGWVVKDDRLFVLARSAPETRAELARIDGLSPGLIRRHGDELLEAMNAGTHGDIDRPARKPRFTRFGKALLQRLVEALKIRAREHEISMSLVATRRDLEMAVGRQPGVRLYEGWREEFFGAEVRAAVEEHEPGTLCD